MQGAELELEQLYEEYQEDTRFKHLRQPGIKFVPGQGPFHPTVMLIGEAPGRMENAKCLPFVGTAGMILNELLTEVGLNPREIYVTNIVKYLPKTDEGSLRPPTEEEIIVSRSYIKHEIDLIDPLIVGLCGRIPLKTMFPQYDVVRKYHGTLLDGRYVPLYHPAHLSYNPDNRATVLVGYRKLKKYAEQSEKYKVG